MTLHIRTSSARTRVKRLWMRWRWHWEGITPASGRFWLAYPSSSRVLQKACQNNVPWSATTKPLTSK
jgi:hypothetical protein